MSINNSNNPIVILGFGRSGTTWLSDIISKAVGGLILFEPFHPEVCAFAKAYCYHNGSDKEILEKGALHLQDSFDKKKSNKWLIRNHLSSSLEEVSDEFVSQVWSECAVIGYKAIRQNFMIPWVYANISKNIVFVKRDLLSVVSSLIKRKQFWKEFGFEFHEKKFFTEVLISNRYAFFDSTKLTTIYNGLQDDYLKMAFLWIVTHYVAEYDLKRLGIPYFKYEDLYLDPYKTTNKILSHIGHEDVTLHPSYLFTPSMLTLRTFHTESFDKSWDMEFFWKDTLSKDMISSLLRLQSTIADIITT